MINYSIVMRPVNTNLVEINQAKGRINEAKKHNQEPAESPVYDNFEMGHTSTSVGLATGIIIVVNDNEMSIAENHGGIYKNLRALRESNGTCQHNWFKSGWFFIS